MSLKKKGFTKLQFVLTLIKDAEEDMTVRAFILRGIKRLLSVDK